MKKNRIKLILIFVLLFLTSIVWAGVSYLKDSYVVSFEMLVVTMFSNLTGTGPEVILKALNYMLPKMVLFILMFAIIVFFISPVKYTIQAKIQLGKSKFTINFTKVVLIMIVLSCLSIVMKSISDLGVIDYFRRKGQKSTIYENEFVDPNGVSIISDGDEKNIIYIYLESMESTYQSIDDGGQIEYELIPNLNKLAKDNINFSFNDKVGGFHNTAGTGWTVAALMASESGATYSFPIDRNDMNPDSEFAPNLVMLGDILEKEGYKQEFLCGSDARFGSRNALFKTHGNYKIYDYYSALNDGYVDDFVFWGLKDEDLYKIAKDELIKLAADGQKFNFTMLTVDTHPDQGYFCDLCENKYESQYYNVINCADRQVAEFVKWIQEQDFYENTIIVISGDHITMQGDDENAYSDHSNRYVYNCFINTDYTNSINSKNREFNILDMYPTILSAMNFEIEGDRLGLGTNLFSNLDTLEEKYGFEYMNDELSKYSQYFAEHFY